MTSIHGHKEFANKACPVFSVPDFLKRYGISKYPMGGWDSKRWPHFKPAEFDQLYEGDMPRIWEMTLDALERLRAAYGHPLVLLHTEYNHKMPALMVDIKVPDAARADVIRKAIKADFVSARTVSNGVRVYMEEAV